MEQTLIQCQPNTKEKLKTKFKTIELKTGVLREKEPRNKLIIV